MLVILPRYVPQYPPADYLGCRAGIKTLACLGAPLDPMPLLQTHLKPVCAATIRSGPGYLEVPFVATAEGKRGRGHCRLVWLTVGCSSSLCAFSPKTACSAYHAYQHQLHSHGVAGLHMAHARGAACMAPHRCIVEAIEDICRALGLRKLMLCSTDDAIVKSTWQHLGFYFTTEEDMEEWDIPHSDLVYLQNTVQVGLHKHAGEGEVPSGGAGMDEVGSGFQNLEPPLQESWRETPQPALAAQH